AALRGIRVDSMSARAWLAAASADTAHERQWLDRALVLSPRDPLTLETLARLAGFAGDTAAQYGYLRRAIDVDPSNPQYLLGFGSVGLFRRRYRGALRWFDSAVPFQPEAPYFYFNRGYTRMQVGDTAGARADAARTRQLGNDTAAVVLEVLLAVRGGDSVA